MKQILAILLLAILVFGCRDVFGNVDLAIDKDSTHGRLSEILV